MNRAITEAVAVVGCGPDGAELAVEELLVAFHAQLVRSIYLFHVVLVQEPVDDIDAKHVACASRRKSEARVVLIRV